MALKTVKKGCPACGGDVVGNDEFRFFCKKCNMLFKERDLKKEKKEDKKDAKQ
ncbi:MAG: hypothetical protein ABIE94_00355 [archaeon]